MIITSAAYPAKDYLSSLYWSLGLFDMKLKFHIHMDIAVIAESAGYRENKVEEGNLA